MREGRDGLSTGSAPSHPRRILCVLGGEWLILFRGAAFELGESDSMMGQPFPDSLVIEARLDSDGDPTTRSPTDPKARVERVKVGRSDVHLVLR